MEVGQCPNWGCSANGKKNNIESVVREIGPVDVDLILPSYYLLEYDTSVLVGGYEPLGGIHCYQPLQ
jgi:hypothetical protein